VKVNIIMKMLSILLNNSPMLPIELRITMARNSDMEVSWECLSIATKVE